MFNGIEAVMEDIESVFKTNFQTVITNINSDYGDSLLESFDEDAYYTWGLDEVPHFDVFYLQYLVGEPILMSNGPMAAVRYGISIGVFFPFQGAALNSQRKVRYNRVMYTLIQDYLVKKYPSIQLSGFGSTFLTTEEDREFTMSELAFSLDIAH